ncbi:peptidoglycan DD-metalloendopeptidase family protein [Nocardioides sp. NPDC006303]|uniref:peptidoglycan DD-metalloendopeptidase family protein n=1 Tax=Nocardioides sp. NPDC006303 TaxID=3156747 RepID=UPI0033BF9BCD
MWIFKARLIWGIVAGAATLVLVVTGALVILIGGLASTEQSNQDQAESGCVGGTNAIQAGNLGPDGEVPEGSIAGFTTEQIQNARTIVAVGKQSGVPAYGWVIALATAMQESTLRNLNYGDRDSQGLFQQRPVSGWGSVADITNPVKSAQAFYGVATHTGNTGLLDIPGWRKMQVTAAAQAVQRSAFPLAYAQHEDEARALVAALADGVSAADLAATATDVACTIGMAGISTSVVRPIQAGLAVDNDNYGNSGSNWANMHTGNDYSSPCGTPVQAAHGGTIVLESGGSWGWAGRWLVKVQTAPGNLTTWYGHMQSLSVAAGQTVKAGQVIGQVGSEGNSTGCHLHFEVHPHGGGYLQDQVDPAAWLDKNIGKTLETTKQVGGLPGAGQVGASPAAVSGPQVRLAQANIKVSMSSSRYRSDLAKVMKHGPDFVSLNEAQSRSVSDLSVRGYGTYRASSDEYGTRSQALSPVVMWRTDRWVAVDKGTVQLTKPVTGVKNDNRYATWVVLASSDGSGRISVISTHTMTSPANSPQARKNEAQRGFAKLAGLAQGLQKYGPVLVAGDLNSPYPRNGGDGDPWGPKPLMTKAGMTSSFETLGAPPQGWATHDGGGTIDWLLGSSSTATPTRHATFKLDSDHHGLVGDFNIRGQ